MAAKHSAIVRQVGARVGRDDEPAVAVFQASCVCGWSADQTYTRYQRACKAYQRHAKGGALMTVQIIQGDVREMLATLDAESIQTCVTSPPYYALRDYGVDGQIGLEQTPAAFIAELVAVFDQVKRVLRPDATLWVNLGDSYAGSGKGPQGNSLKESYWTKPETRKISGARTFGGIKAKDLILIPERFAIAMQDAGWYVRSRIAWCKLSAMPESVRDRPTSAWEHIWLFTKSARYFWDADAVRQPNKTGDDPRNRPDYEPKRLRDVGGRADGYTIAEGAIGWNAAGANLRNYWLLGPEPSREEHYAAFPTEIPRRAILAGTSERGQCPACGSPWVRQTESSYRKHRPSGGHTARIERGNKVHDGGFGGWGTFGTNLRKDVVTTGWQPSCRCDAGEPVPQVVLDPFLGTGTTALVADRLGRHAVGVELNPKYAEIARRRISNDAPMFAEVQVG